MSYLVPHAAVAVIARNAMEVGKLKLEARVDSLPGDAQSLPI